MAEPGDPKRTVTPPEPDPDDLVGFASPSSLAGRPRAPDAPPRPTTEPESPPWPEPASAEPDLFDPPAPLPSGPLSGPPSGPAFAPEREPGPEPEPIPAWARETRPVATAAPQTYAQAPEVQGGMGLYAVYALILFAVPTLGASALLALLAVIGRQPPEDPAAASHFVFQQRTLFAGAVAALAGAILVIVNLGVFVLFVLALWLIFRGAWGVLRLKAGRPIDHPRRWLV